VGSLHELGCDQEECSYCGLQYIGCERHYGNVPDDDRLAWEGVRKLEEAALRLGWYARLTATGWTPCDRSTAGASLDLNRVCAECRWDRTTKQFVL
jgi:hypothetical protein